MALGPSWLSKCHQSSIFFLASSRVFDSDNVNGVMINRNRFGFDSNVESRAKQSINHLHESKATSRNTTLSDFRANSSAFRRSFSKLLLRCKIQPNESTRNR